MISGVGDNLLVGADVGAGEHTSDSKDRQDSTSHPVFCHSRLLVSRWSADDRADVQVRLISVDTRNSSTCSTCHLYSL